MEDAVKTKQMALAERSLIGYIPAEAFADFSEVNYQRCEHFEGDSDGFTILEFGGALAGEAGELANVLKKIRRAELGIKMEQDDIIALKVKAAEEIADVFMYLDLIASMLGVDIVTAVAAKFNQTSMKNDAPFLVGVLKRVDITDEGDANVVASGA